MSVLRRTRCRCASAATFTALGVAALAALPAAAPAADLRHIGGVGTGLAPTTAGPDLRAVTVDPTNDLTDGLGERARFCFDQNIATVNPGFALMSYDARRFWSGAGARATDDEKCAVVTFPAGSDIAQATVGQVGPSAVADVASKGNIVASEPVAGSVATPVAGATTGPDLVAVDVDSQDAAAKRVTFTFDENLAPVPSDKRDFAYVLQDGDPVPAAAAGGMVTPVGNKVTIDFGTAPVETAARFVTNPGAVTDRPQTTVLSGSGLPLATPSSPGVVVKSTPTGGRPDLVKAEPAGPNAYKLTYNTGVTTPVAGRFQAVADDGIVSAVAASVGTGGTQDAVIVQFSDSEALTKDPGSVVRIISASAAVRSSTDSTKTSIYGQSPTQTTNNKPGFTNGPDLLVVGVDTATQRVGFGYDEPVASSTPAANFLGFRSDTTSSPGQGATSSSGTLIAVNFGAGIGDFVAYGQNYNAVTDPLGRPNPTQSVSKDVQPAGGTSPPVVPILPPPVATPRTKVTTKVSLRRRGNRFSGTASASRFTCKFNRTVILRKKGKATTRYGTARTRSNGTFSITKRRPSKGTYYVFIPAKVTKTIACSKATSRSVRVR